MLDYLPDALWDEILVRLPHTRLVQLASVCKAWRSFIVRPTFNLQYSLSNPTPPLLLIHTLSPLQWSLFNTAPFPSPVTPILQPPYPSTFRFVESLNGIVCLIDQSDRSIVLWNPSVRRHLRLQLGFPNYSAIGFGFDSKNHDFKVIRFSHPDPDRVELYSLNEGAWRVIYFSLEVGEFANTRCFLNGNVHWIVTPRYPLKSNRVLIFNVGEEKFKNMELPPELVYFSHYFLEVTVIEGCLSVLRYNYVDIYACDCDIDIWTMREYGVVDSWTKIRTVNLKGGGHVFGLSTGKVLAPLHEVGRELVSLLSFDTKSQETTDLKIQGYVSTACEYTQSLVLLDGKRDGVFCPANKRIKLDTDYYSCPKLSRTSTTHASAGSPRLM